MRAQGIIRGTSVSKHAECLSFETRSSRGGFPGPSGDPIETRRHYRLRSRPNETAVYSPRQLHRQPVVGHHRHGLSHHHHHHHRHHHHHHHRRRYLRRRVALADAATFGKLFLSFSIPKGSPPSSFSSSFSAMRGERRVRKRVGW